MKTLFVSNLPPEASENTVKDLFSQYGTVRSIKVTRDIYTGKCRGFGFIQMEGHEARAAITGIDGKDFGGNALRVRYEDKTRGGRGKRR